jgi:hypothetical protein
MEYYDAQTSHTLDCTRRVGVYQFTRFFDLGFCYMPVANGGREQQLWRRSHLHRTRRYYPRSHSGAAFVPTAPPRRGQKPFELSVRLSDSAQQDINTLANGSLDAATLTTFLTSATGKIVACYDKAGTNDLTQATDANRSGDHRERGLLSDGRVLRRPMFGMSSGRRER